MPRHGRPAPLEARTSVRPPSAGLGRYDWLAETAQSPYLIGEFVEIKTVWHPIGA